MNRTGTGTAWSPTKMWSPNYQVWSPKRENEESNFVKIWNYWCILCKKIYTFKHKNVPIPPTGFVLRTYYRGFALGPHGDFRHHTPSFVESKKSLNYTMGTGFCFALLQIVVYSHYHFRLGFCLTGHGIGNHSSLDRDPEGRPQKNLWVAVARFLRVGCCPPTSQRCQRTGGTSCARGNTICPAPLLPPRAPKPSRAAEQTQRSSTFPRRIRSHADRCSRLTGWGRAEWSGLVTLTFDLLTLKVVSESRVTWAISVPILVFWGLSVLELSPMYATDKRQTSDKSIA